ncbi:sterol desaturase family protein [uncultured Algimonas sp.]|uniref:sterol desaturase family protein n=1 Tax=uncultured Algimonas sp. TaxID=1547920 RepID=UPI0026164AD1|nr:sterol desaturase family protein [uncultured Algimonas sp.]
MGGLVALGAFICAVVAERLYYRLAGRTDYDDASAMGSLGVFLISLVMRIAFTLLLPIGVVLLASEAAPLDIPVAWWSWLAAFLLVELCWYVDHRLQHRVGLLWAMHHVHHSAERLHMAAASRAFILDGVLRAELIGLVALAGFSPAQIIPIIILSDIFGIFSHSEAIRKLGWLDRWLATPANHRVHHASNPEYIDRNYGHVLMLWDRLLGTFEPETLKPRFGVTEPIDTNNPLRIYGGGFVWMRRKLAACDTLGQKFECLWRPPEWSPSCSGDTDLAR